jgi:hypothetical protein
MEFKLIYLARRNPSVRAEDWPRTWRSHAVFVSRFPSVYARFTGVLYCSRVLEPTLDGVPFEPPTARDYDGVALVSGPSVEGLRTDPPPEMRARIDEDELRVFSTHTPNFSFICREVLVHGGAAGQAAVLRFLARKSDGSSESFFATWNGDYASSAVRAADASGRVTRYVHNRLVEKPPPGYPFDGVTETWFASTEDAVRSFADGSLAPLAQLSAFCDPERCVTLLTSVTHRWPRLEKTRP